MKVVSCFAGIGGFDLGLERAGMHTVAVVEQDKSCRKLLVDKFPHAAQFDDVCTVGKRNLPECDLVCGGFPCQDVSVAGDRAGLAGDRTGLYFQLTRIVDELRPPYFLFENVPGLYSSDDGRDFARVLMELARIGYDGAWRVFDAQYLGLAQRRRRIFGLFTRLDSGASRCAKVLSLSEGMRWNPPPSREEREGLAPALTSGSGGGRYDKQPHTIAHTHTGNGFDASKDGTGRGTPFIPTIADCLQERDSKGSDSSTKNGHLIPCAFSSKDHGADAGELSPTLRAMGHAGSHANGGGQIAVAFNLRGRAGGAMPEECDAVSLRAASGGSSRSYVAQTLTADMYRSGGATAGNNQGVRNVLLPGVRRLTPLECERLQGFPDNWTKGFSDSTRYKMLGNAVAVPCAEWIGKRIIAYAARWLFMA